MKDIQLLEHIVSQHFDACQEEVFWSNYSSFHLPYARRAFIFSLSPSKERNSICDEGSENGARVEEAGTAKKEDTVGILVPVVFLSQLASPTGTPRLLVPAHRPPR